MTKVRHKTDKGNLKPVNKILHHSKSTSALKWSTLHTAHPTGWYMVGCILYISLLESSLTLSLSYLNNLPFPITFKSHHQLEFNTNLFKLKSCKKFDPPPSRLLFWVNIFTTAADWLDSLASHSLDHVKKNWFQTNIVLNHRLQWLV